MQKSGWRQPPACADADFWSPSNTPNVSRESWLDLQSWKNGNFNCITCFLVGSFVSMWMGTWEEHWRHSSLWNLHGLGTSEMKKMYLSLRMQITSSSSLTKQNPGGVWQSLSLGKLPLFYRVLFPLQMKNSVNHWSAEQCKSLIYTVLCGKCALMLPDLTNCLQSHTCERTDLIIKQKENRST